MLAAIAKKALLVELGHFSHGETCAVEMPSQHPPVLPSRLMVSSLGSSEQR